MVLGQVLEDHGLQGLTKVNMDFVPNKTVIIYHCNILFDRRTPQARSRASLRIANVTDWIKNVVARLSGLKCPRTRQSCAITCPTTELKAI